MSIERYLLNVLRKEELGEKEKREIEDWYRKIRSLLDAHFRDQSRIYYAGSYKKGTANSSSYDFDILVYVSKDYGSAKEISEKTYNILTENGLVCKNKNIAYTYKVNKDFHIDIVPGKALDNNFEFAHLYNRDSDSKIRTSIKQHMESVKHIKREIRLMKIWKEHQKNSHLNIKTFVLEQVIIKAMKNKKPTSAYNNLQTIFHYIHQTVTELKINDPADPNNNIKPYLDPYRKLLKKLSKEALDILENEDSFSRGCTKLFGKPYNFKDKKW